MPLARGVALPGPLHLDHLGPHVGQDHGAEGTRHVLGEVEHPEPGQRSRGIAPGHL